MQTKNNQKINFKLVKPADCLTLRQLVLRKNKAIETCIFDGDQLKSTFHIGAFFNSQLIGILSLMPFKNDRFRLNKQYQLRGMAIHPKMQSKGVGKELLTYSLRFLQNKNINLCWCNARAKAVNFYQKHGFNSYGEEFEIKEVGPHLLMAFTCLPNE
ncbi:GNAT family N-acetyltransferase [Psychroflexus maritimus]|uniref:GNAT family N-acetyltransferase n=1 Tax=Psychroflexus maritimus TaxID=2714865 RepID=A0A967AIC3_9FLAO|nr:GNAT family N-acetyltransferase [Psychroflexus maritimus]NGZ89880.1 GNAT family N-acetyltransferase [Psychroflexus maritimus]